MILESKEFEQLYSRLLFYARKLTKGNIPEAEDLLHDSLIKILENMNVFNEKKGVSFLRFASSVMHNLYIDRLRYNKYRGRPKYIENIENYTFKDPMPDVPQIVSTRNMYRAVKKALKTYPWSKKYIPIFLMRGMGLTYKEIAVMLGKPVPWVKSHLYRMREEIFQHYKNKDEKGWNSL
jgi:RNA polymerase sigma factor (sigma-70 family)